MGDVVNLRRVRKAKVRAEAETLAQAARLRHGRTAAERTATETETERARRSLDAHRRDDPGPAGRD